MDFTNPSAGNHPVYRLPVGCRTSQGNGNLEGNSRISAARPPLSEKSSNSIVAATSKTQNPKNVASSTTKTRVMRLPYGTTSTLSQSDNREQVVPVVPEQNEFEHCCDAAFRFLMSRVSMQGTLGHFTAPKTADLTHSERLFTRKSREKLFEVRALGPNSMLSMLC